MKLLLRMYGLGSSPCLVSSDEDTMRSTALVCHDQLRGEQSDAEVPKGPAAGAHPTKLIGVLD